MAKRESVEQTADNLLTQIEKNPPPRPAQYGWLIIVALLAVIVISVALGRDTSPKLQSGTTSPLVKAPPLANLPINASGSRFLRVAPGEGGLDDIYLYSSTTISDPSNLTKSPAINEVWPVPDSSGEHVAYYGINSAGIEVYLLYVDRSRAPLPLPVKAGDSTLHAGFEITPTLAPVFSPSQTWVAFPAQSTKGDVVEVFIAQTDGQQVVRATALNQQVIDYIWLDDNTLTVTYRSPDSTLHSVVYPLNSSGLPFATLTP